MTEFIEAIKNNNIGSLSIGALENIAIKYPYFQLNKTLLLKKYHQQEHFKYNNSLKNVAAHTVNREILFDFITQIQETKQEEKKEEKKVEKEIEIITAQKKEEEVVIIPIVETPSVTTEKLEIKEEISKPLPFTNSDTYSFNQWLQVSNPEPIKREIAKTEVKEEEVVDIKTKIINKFISNNPKINPIKKNVPPSNSTLTSNNKDISNELMTETLAKVYLAQKKYENAIQAYKILSLKYPEKSSFFADQMQKIKILQTHK